jgi:hypothetical protein
MRGAAGPARLAQVGQPSWPRRAGLAEPARLASKLPVVNRTTRWLLPAVLALLVLGVLIGAALH